MQLSKALFCFAFFCITATLADFRHIPDRSKMFCEERHLNFMHSLRHLEDTSLNSRNNSAPNKSAEPITVRLQGGTELGYYYVTLFMGTPVQKQTLIVDTGSVTTTVPCVECGHDCGTHHFDKPFNNNNSNSFQPFKCEEKFGEYYCSDCTQHCPFSVSYVEGSSYRGHFNKDFVVFGNEIEDNYSLLKQNDETQDPEVENTLKPVEEAIQGRKVFMPFGCTNKETKLFYDQEADGILGLGVNTNTGSSPPNLLDALKIKNENYSIAFSLCLAQNGGYFTLGGYNAAYHLSNEKPQYTEYSDAFGQYKVFISKIEMEGKSIGLKPAVLNSGEGAFFDSGTTLTHVPSATYNALRSHLHSYCQEDQDRCGKNSETTQFCWKYHADKFSSLTEFHETFPTFTFVFGRDKKVNYEWKAQDYLYEKEDSQHEYCLGLSHYERETILGGTFMKNHDILFDKENKRIGFARADCSAVQEISQPTYKEKKETDNNLTRPDDKVITPEDPGKEDNGLVSLLVVLNGPIKVVLAVIVICSLGAAIVFIYRGYKKERPYRQMRNVNIEIPTPGINERPFNASAVQTPERQNSQPPQDERTENESDLSQSNPEIRVD